MVCHGKPFSSLSDLSMFVNETICDQEQLEVGAFQMTERILTRCGHPCGIYFCVHGPRQVKFTAIWETDNNTVLLYGASGERTLRTQLVDAPNLQTAVAGSDFNDIPPCKAVIIMDNESRNKEVVRTMEKLITEDYSIVIWPDTITHKDINDCVLAGVNVKEIIKNNIHQGLSAMMAIANWKKT